MRVNSSDFKTLNSYQYTHSQKTQEPSSSPKTDPSLRQKTPDEQALITELSSIDTKVKAHESAHLAAGGGVVSGGASFSYTKGPDGKMYATAGEVPIDSSEGKTPEETLRRARQITAAALAPADPSPQDYKVAASAAMMEMRAQLEITKELQNNVEGKKAYASADEPSATPSSPSDTQSPVTSPERP